MRAKRRHQLHNEGAFGENSPCLDVGCRWTPGESATIMGAWTGDVSFQQPTRSATNRWLLPHVVHAEG